MKTLLVVVFAFIFVHLGPDMLPVEISPRPIDPLSLDQRINRLERGWSNGAAAFLFAAVCALWAQYTKRNAWLWFFLGLIFSVVAILVLLYKNSNDLKMGKANYLR